MFICIHTSADTYTYSSLSLYIYIYTRIYIYICIYTCISLSLSIYIYIYIHTRTQAVTAMAVFVERWQLDAAAQAAHTKQIRNNTTKKINQSYNYYRAAGRRGAGGSSYIFIRNCV